MKKKTLALATSLLIPFLSACQGEEIQEGSYTYNSFLAANPRTWNVHNWQNSTEGYIPSFTEIGFYSVVLNSAKNGYEFVDEMAGGDPVAVQKEDVTDGELDTFFDGRNVSLGQVYDVPLNKEACFEDGTKIDADTYIESMKLLLDPEYVNFRADNYYKNTVSLANAERYFKQRRETVESCYPFVNADGSLKENAGQDGAFYLNIGRENGFANAYFNATGKTLLDVFGGILSPSSEQNLAFWRIKDAVYGRLLLLFQTDYNKYSSYFDAYLEKWQKASAPNDLSKDMVLNHPDISIFDFDRPEVRVSVRKNLDYAESEVYSSSLLKKDLQVVAKLLGKSQDFAWEYPLYCNYLNDESVSFSKVGLVKRDAYTLRFYLTKALTESDFKFGLATNFLVKPDLYKSLTTEIGRSKATKYATEKVENYCSYGPYKLTKYEANKRIVMERNEKWYGYHDGRHEGQFQMTRVNTSILPNHSTAMLEFEKGNIDEIDLSFQDMKKYGSSQRKQTTYESYTQKLSFNGSREKLLERQKGLPGKNKTLLANRLFREAISLSINRRDFASQATAGSKPFTGLLNDLYIWNATSLDPSVKTQSYRATAAGKSVYASLYKNLGGNAISVSKDGVIEGGEPLPESENGYNFSAALAIGSYAVSEELSSSKEGHLLPSDTLAIEYKTANKDSETAVAISAFLRKSLTDLLGAINKKLGTSLSLELTTLTDENYYQSAEQGNYDMIVSTWGGASINPYGIMQVYCDKSFLSNVEYGLKGNQDKIEVWIDFNEDGEKSNDEIADMNTWCQKMNFDAETIQNPEKRLQILAGLERAYLEEFQAIPLAALGSSSLISFKVESATKTYVPLVGYGGIRSMTFNFDDKGWAAFLSKNEGRLSDLYKA